jgi:AraC-like DNA-binding protein
VGLRSLVVMVHEAAPQRGERARAEREGTPSVPLPVDGQLRSWVVGDQHPATLVTGLAVKVTDQPWHPPVLVNGPRTTSTRVQGPWAPAIAARLAPLDAYKLLGPVVSDIGAMVGLEDIVGPDARRLGEQIQSASTWDERRQLLDGFLLDRATRGPQPSPEVTHAWSLLVGSGGRSTIRSVARQVGWSHKHLITRFKQQVGVAPQMAARLLRLSTVWEHLDREQTWARIAAESGYADQAHLIREFRRFTGTTPGALTTT